MVGFPDEQVGFHQERSVIRLPLVADAFDDGNGFFDDRLEIIFDRAEGNMAGLAPGTVAEFREQLEAIRNRLRR